MLKLFTAAIIAIVSASLALVNPSLQPMQVFDRYDAIVLFTITATDDATRSFTLTKRECLKGTFATETVTVTAKDEKLERFYSTLIHQDAPLLALIGKRMGKRQLNEILFYTGEGKWEKCEFADADAPSRWLWTEDTGEAYFGCFNGRIDRLVEMVHDHYRTGRFYFPHKPCMRFKADQTVGKLPGPGRGVALYDLDRDGRLDVYACSLAGDRVWMQVAPLHFVERTQAVGLSGLASPSVSCADVNGDGFPDLLVGSVLHLADGTGRFAATALLPPLDSAKLKTALLLDANGDGFPDVLVSQVQGGLHLYLNSGKAPIAFRDVSEEAGLRATPCAPQSTGFVCWGDWNQDQRIDLFYAAKRGLLLTQDASGRFTVVKSFGGYDFASTEGVEGASGAGCFAPIWRPDRSDVITALDTGLVLLGNEQGKIVDLTSEANEITEKTPAMQAVIAEDLNADGTVDTYGLSRNPVASILHSNRGYGSLMADHKYDRDIYPGSAHYQGAWGAAAGDVDGDGVNDLLLAGHDGTITLLINDALSLRQPQENLPYHDQLRQQARYLTVALTGRLGVLGAEIALVEADGRVAARRIIGSNVATGCRSPDAASIAVLWPGIYRLDVRFSNGVRKIQSVDLTSQMRTRLTVSSDP